MLVERVEDHHIPNEPVYATRPPNGVDFHPENGQSIDYYMKHAYAWLGWGIHGARTQYAHSYYNKMALTPNNPNYEGKTS